MTAYFQDSHSTLYQGDARVVLAELEPESVDMVVTSPPYWALRSYAGIEPLIFGGDPECAHGEMETTDDAPVNYGGPHGTTAQVGATKSAIQRPQEHYTGKTRWQQVAQEAQDKGILVRDVKPGAWETAVMQSASCRLCGAWSGHYGLEPTPQMYIEHSLEFLDAIWRVLKKSGTAFWNLGDSWVGGKGQSGYELPHEAQERKRNGQTIQTGNEVPGYMSMRPSDGKFKTLKPKDMALIPFRFAIAAQERGWWVRSVIIWDKNNPMPESVKDRPTDAHEYIFLLTKSKRYYWNADAVREPHSKNSHGGGQQDPMRHHHLGASNRNKGLDIAMPGDHNIRSVWHINTAPYSEAHFATFPLAIPQTCIKAGCPPGGIVLDPFAGAGTTLWAAKTLGVKSIGVELSEAYCKLAVDRIRQQVLL